MTTYAIEFTAAAAKELRKLDPPARRRVVAAVEALSTDPRQGARKLIGLDDAWRIRVGDYRILYEIDDVVVLITVIRIGHRRSVYERL